MPSVISCTLRRVFEPCSFDDLNRGTYTLTYDIVTDGILGPIALRTQAESASPHPLPSYGSTYSYQGDTDSGAYATLPNITSDSNQQTRYIATVVFKPPDDDDVTIFEPDPFLRPPIVWFDREAYQAFIARDAAGNLILNKCGQRYDPGVEKQHTRPVLVVEFNRATLGQVGALIDTYTQATNAIEWNVLGWIIPPRCAFAQDVIASKPITQGFYTYFHVEMRFIFDSRTFDEPMVERGNQHFNKDAAGEFEVDAQGNKVRGFTVKNVFGVGDASPIDFNLAEDGTKLPDGEFGIVTSWRINKEVNFNLLTA